ncbi:MAG TPA: hypothetical protein VFQ65_13135 [Kofleriaceae bacterium]|nr:hypothetical protein [Kofleriaceae bacterium]
MTSLVLFAACGGSPLDPGAGNSAGGGTSTLLVTGSATATPRLTNAQQASDFDTAFSVRIELANAPVTTGTVTMTSSRGATALAFTTNGNQSGRWTGDASGYDEVYQLDVTSGADKVTGVIVDGPDIHVITAPTAGAALDSTVPFTTTWNRAATADIARFQMGDTDGIVVPDTGNYSVAAGTLKASQDKAQTNTLRLTRENRITPAGALTGSEMTVGVENELDVVASPCPSC